MRGARSVAAAQYAARSALYVAQPADKAAAEIALRLPVCAKTGKPLFAPMVWRLAAALEWEAFCRARREAAAAEGGRVPRRTVVLDPIPGDWKG